MSIKRKWDLSSDETKRTCIDKIIHTLDETLDEQIGVLTAEELLDVITEVIGPDLYAKGVTDAKQLVDNKLGDLAIDLEVLKQ